MLRKDQEWELAPAYDLCFSYNPDNHWVSQQTLSVNGKRLHITPTDLLLIAKQNNIKKAPAILQQINAVVRQWKHYAKQAEVRADLISAIEGELGVW